MRALIWALGPLAAVSLVYGAVHQRYNLPDRPILSKEVQGQAMAYLRLALDRPGEGDPPGDGVALPGPLWVSLYDKGETIARHASLEGDLATRLRAAAQALGVQARGARRRALIKVDLAASQGPVVSAIPLLLAHSFVPGLDGIQASHEGQVAHLLPDELYRRQLLSGYQPFYFMREFQSGVDLDRALRLLARKMNLAPTQPMRLSRFRVQSFVEGPHEPGRSLEVKRYRVPVRTINRAKVRQAVERAADYVLRQIQPSGQFHYIYYPLDDRHSPQGDYSLPRHAGTTWFLALAYGALGEQRFLEGASRAIAYLGAHAVPPSCQTTPYACVGEERSADLGSAALAAVAIAEYQEATGDKKYEPLARRLGDFIIHMQRPNGDFCHRYRPHTQTRLCDDMLLYYSGEAALALAKLYGITREAKVLASLERAMDFLTDEKYDFFLGQFFVSEDHWTCIAAEAAVPFVDKDQYAKLAYAFGQLNGRVQIQPGEGLMEDLAGAFAITPFFTPHNTPVGSRTEANVASYLLSQRRGEPQEDILQTLRLSVRYLVDQQISPESAYLFPNPEAALGGIMKTPASASIRIDYVQHAAAAMARALPLIPEEDWALE